MWVPGIQRGLGAGGGTPLALHGPSLVHTASTLSPTHRPHPTPSLRAAAAGPAQMEGALAGPFGRRFVPAPHTPRPAQPPAPPPPPPPPPGWLPRTRRRGGVRRARRATTHSVVGPPAPPSPEPPHTPACPPPHQPYPVSVTPRCAPRVSSRPRAVFSAAGPPLPTPHPCRPLWPRPLPPPCPGPPLLPPHALARSPSRPPAFAPVRFCGPVLLRSGAAPRPRTSCGGRRPWRRTPPAAAIAVATATPPSHLNHHRYRHGLHRP